MSTFIWPKIKQVKHFVRNLWVFTIWFTSQISLFFIVLVYNFIIIFSYEADVTLTSFFLYVYNIGNLVLLDLNFLPMWSYMYQVFTLLNFE